MSVYSEIVRSYILSALANWKHDHRFPSFKLELVDSSQFVSLPGGVASEGSNSLNDLSESIANVPVSNQVPDSRNTQERDSGFEVYLSSL